MYCAQILFFSEPVKLPVSSTNTPKTVFDLVKSRSSADDLVTYWRVISRLKKVETDQVHPCIITSAKPGAARLQVCTDL